MSWGRGLWRMWLVVTLLWVGLITWDMGPIDRLSRLGDPVTFSAVDVELEFPGDMEPGLIKGAVAKWIQKQRDGKAKNYFDRFDEPPERIADRIVGNFQPRTAAGVWRDWASLALLPPAIIFVVGALVFWALRGFRRDHPQSGKAT